MTQVDDAPIKLIHGWGMNHKVWQETFAYMDEQLRARITCLDLPGYGHNEFCPEPYNLTSLTSWLSEQITEPTHIIGWSLGGLLAINFAAQHPERVLSLGLVASTPKFVADESWPGIAPKVLAGFSQQLQDDHQKTVTQFLKIQAMGSPHVKQDIQLLQKHLLELPKPQVHSLQGGLEMLNDVDIRREFADLNVPVFGLYGQADSLVPKGSVKEMQSLLPSANLTLLPKHSHAPFVSDPTGFVRWLKQVCGVN